MMWRDIIFLWFLFAVRMLTMAHMQLITSHTTDPIASGSVESTSTPLIVSVSPVSISSNYFLLNCLLNYVVMCRCVLVLSLDSAVSLQMDGDSQGLFLLDLIRIFLPSLRWSGFLLVNTYIIAWAGRDAKLQSPRCAGAYICSQLCVFWCVYSTHYLDFFRFYFQNSPNTYLLHKQTKQKKRKSATAEARKVTGFSTF